MVTWFVIGLAVLLVVGGTAFATWLVGGDR